MEKCNFTSIGYIIPFGQISSLIKNSKHNKNSDFQILIHEYMMFSARSFFISAYEAFKEDTIRYDTVKDSSWFVFLSNIRNAVAHGLDAVWDLKYYGTIEIYYVRQKDNQKILIKKEWDKKPMLLEHIGGLGTIIDLLRFITRYVDNEIKASNA